MNHGKSEIQEKDMSIRSLSRKPCRPCKLCKPKIGFKTLQLIWYQKHKQCKLSKLGKSKSKDKYDKY